MMEEAAQFGTQKGSHTHMRGENINVPKNTSAPTKVSQNP
ncbi:hypothetical protein ACIDI_111c00020 [Acidiphilium sp. JA12-A1]|nr:hypothetical protein ACIDI_111c00020 [Acidiphilium sp. JA12-A1]